MLAIIVARSKNNVIGKDGKIPWKIQGEQKQFKELTTGNTVIMGRRTFEEIGRPLPNRLNIVISHTAKYTGDNIITVKNLDQALYLATENAYIAGGYGVFKEALPLVDKMYITEVNMNVENGTVFFPEFNEEDFNKIITEENEEYKRVLYTRKVFTAKKDDKYSIIR